MKVNHRKKSEEFIEKYKVGVYYSTGQQQYKLMQNCSDSMMNNFKDMITKKLWLETRKGYEDDEYLELYYSNSRGNYRRDILYPDNERKTYKNMILHRLEKELQSLKYNKEQHNDDEYFDTAIKKVENKIDKIESTDDVNKIEKIYERNDINE